MRPKSGAVNEQNADILFVYYICIDRLCRYSENRDSCDLPEGARMPVQAKSLLKRRKIDGYSVFIMASGTQKRDRRDV